MKPKITVITVSFNAAAVIEKTIKSVQRLNYANLEYIIVDGMSTDGTLEIVHSYKDFISKFISEKDNGIYDAMNKGISLASGDWIIFMNAGDSFYSSDILDILYDSGLMNNSDIIYGDVINVFKWGCVKQIGREFQGEERCMPFSHQSVFVKQEIFKKYLYDTSFKIAGDHDLFYKLYQHRYKFNHINEIIALYDVSGISNYSIKSYQEVCHINNIKGINYFMGLIIGYLKLQLKKIMPYQILAKIQYRKFKKANCVLEDFKNPFYD